MTKIPSPWGHITLYRRRSGVTAYRLRGMIDGEHRSVGLYPTIEDAQIAAAEVARQLTAKKRPAQLTVDAWGRRWMEARERLGYRHDLSGVWARRVTGTKLGGMPLRAVRARHVRAWLDGVITTKGKGGKKLSPRTVRNALNALSGALGAATDEGRIKENPAAGVRIPKALTATKSEDWTYLETHEIDRIKAIGPAKPRTAFLFALYTAMRAGEVFGLRWEDVDLRGEQINIRHSWKLTPTKSGKPRSIVMLPPVKPLLEAWRAHQRSRARLCAAKDFVFSQASGAPHVKTYDAGWAKTWRRRVLDDGHHARFHDLRHSCASHLVMGTWGRAWRLEEIQALLGHQSITTTEIYAHLAPSALARVQAETHAQWRE